MSARVLPQVSFGCPGANQIGDHVVSIRGPVCQSGIPANHLFKTTICLELLHITFTFSLSMYFKRQNRLADHGKRPALEQVEGFRYAP
jgi:hypothetical protein